jgi:hypothetical protein
MRFYIAKAEKIQHPWQIEKGPDQKAQLGEYFLGAASNADEHSNDLSRVEYGSYTEASEALELYEADSFILPFNLFIENRSFTESEILWLKGGSWL